jgi:hypothetical protein
MTIACLPTCTIFRLVGLLVHVQQWLSSCRKECCAAHHSVIIRVYQELGRSRLRHRPPSRKVRREALVRNGSLLFAACFDDATGAIVVGGDAVLGPSAASDSTGGIVKGRRGRCRSDH